MTTDPRIPDIHAAVRKLAEEGQSAHVGRLELFRLGKSTNIRQQRLFRRSRRVFLAIIGGDVDTFRPGPWIADLLAAAKKGGEGD